MRAKVLGLSRLALTIPLTAAAGDIPGLAAMTPLAFDQQIELVFSNDFLGRGGSVDDYRTQQIILSADLGPRWTMVFDHSVLTLTDTTRPGRVDQLSASLGYRIFDASDGVSTTRLLGGIGIRSASDYGGERMQNGFHRLIGSHTENLPYSNTSGTELTAWLDTGRSGVFWGSAGDWRLGWELRGRVLATTGGQLDGTAGALLVADRRNFGAWGGVRQDWRNGYDEPVQRATADSEHGLAFVLGVRFGSLVLETVQQPSGDGSYGQLRFLASADGTGDRSFERGRGSIEFGFLLPDVHVNLAGKWRTDLLVPQGSTWRDSVFLSVAVGEPQHESGPTVYADSMQFAAGIEWERPSASGLRWISSYYSLGAGWREERLVGDGALAGARSAAASSAVLTAGAGLRFHASALGSRWRYRIQTGISGWLPLDDSAVVLDARELAVLEPKVTLSVGFTFDFS